MIASLVRWALGLVVSCVLALATGARAQGVFSHQIPIKLPNGANGMQPELALTYASGSGNGIVGMGWQLAGLSQITRINYGSGINYGGTDTYGHSQVGVLTPQHDADNSYRSKKESFTKFVPSGACGDGPCSWVACDRSGMKYYYGTTSSSSLLAQGTSSVRTWALSRVVDLYGNYYTIAYQNDATNGQLYPSVITYTMGPGLSTYRTVNFQYETRNDTEPGYFASVSQQTVQRLKWIIVNSNGTLLRKYRLDYQYGAVTGRSELVDCTGIRQRRRDDASTADLRVATGIPRIRADLEQRQHGGGLDRSVLHRRRQRRRQDRHYSGVEQQRLYWHGRLYVKRYRL